MELTKKDLETMPLLNNSKLDIVFDVLKKCPVRTLAAEEVFIKRGDPSDHMYLTLAGELTIHVEKLDDPAIMTLKSGDSVGEIAILDEKPRSAFVVAKTEAHVVEIDKKVFWELVNSSHEIAVNLLLILSARLRGNNATITENRTSAIVDSLTNLNNRKWINETIPKMIQRSTMGKTPLTVGMIDIDHFKKFNDTYGHQAGDYVLTTVGQTYKDNIRPTDFVARYGGEEFTLIFPDQTKEEAKMAAERVRKAIMALDLTTPDGIKLPPITISIGLAQLKGEETMDEIIARADKVLYDAKEQGRNRVCLAE